MLTSAISIAQVFIPFSFWKGQDSVLTISPSTTQYINPGDLITFTATGETGIYSWSITGAGSADGATIDPTGTPSDYTGRLTSYTTDTVTLTSTTSVNVGVTTYDPMSINPTSLTLAINASQDFSVANGLCVTAPPTACTDATATWSVASGGGSVNASGVFTAPATAGTSVVEVADAIGNVSQATITVTNTLTITPATLKIPVLSTANYSAILGTLPYTYSVFAGSGSTGCSTTLNGAITNTTNPITVVSTAGCPDRGVIYIESEQVCFSGKTATTFTGTAFAGTTVIRGCNGTTAAAHANGVAVNSTRTVYTAPATTGSATVRVTDNLGATSDSAVTIVKPVDLTMGHSSVCTLYSDGSVKCWGENIYGQAGIGTASNIGDLGTEVGGANAFVNLGTGRTATKIVSGLHHVCAFLDNTTVKCWGYNAYGQLGQGNTSNVGNVSATDVANLTPINFGGKTPSDIWAFGYQTCVKYTDDTAVCWGLNTRGQSGQGSLTNITSPPATALNFGSSRYPTKMVGTASATCALLNDSSVQCWGENSTNGQLGNGTNTDLTAPSGTSINLGVGRTAVDLEGSAASGTSTTSEGHFCAALDDSTVKCWGSGSRGQIGDNNANTNNNAPVATQTIGFNVSKIHTGREYSCAETSTGYFKCWGRNTRGQHLMGNTTQRDTPNYCRTTLTGAHTAVVTTITVGSTTGCPSTNGKILIGSEIICYTGLTGTTFTGATRGCDGTTAAAYAGGVTVAGVMNFGTGVLKSKFDITGSRSGCMISTGDQIKCWGNSLNAAGNAISGLFLYYTTSTATNIYIGDSTAELGNGLPFLNH